MKNCEGSCLPAATGAKGLELSQRMLNEGCFCISLDQPALRHAIEHELGHGQLFDLLQQRCPYVFAGHPVFVAQQQLQRMAAVVDAVEQVVALPAWREAALQRAPAIARHCVGDVRGVFFGYDFHVTDQGLGLIEINTNAGGAMLNTLLMRAQRACCEPLQSALPAVDAAQQVEQQLIQMFEREWQASGLDRPLRTLAIVDEKPREQYLYGEFLLFELLFRRHGLQVLIADPSELQWRDGRLWQGDCAIDLVYNRLTDFYLQGDACAALREAWLASAIVLTPHPQAHALYADKRNLVYLSDATALTQLGVAPELQQILLQGIPRTVEVQASDADYWWQQRRDYFFKPNAGFGSRAAWRGDKMTRRVWQDMLAGGYVAQAMVRPGERTLPDQILKFDVRQYVYRGQVQLTAARLYQGQTTNFRTPGGGFAPVYGLPDPDGCCSALSAAQPGCPATPAC